MGLFVYALGVYIRQMKDQIVLPITVELNDEQGFTLRQKAAEWIDANQNKTGAERGSKSEQGYGALAEIVTRNLLGMPAVNPADHPLGYDILLPTGIKVDVKCRGGKRPFQIEYMASDGLAREAKHNFFARQLYDQKLDADIYLLTHLQIAGDGRLPGTKRQRNWNLFICGWVSKERVIKEGVYLPRGSLTEQGNTWFTYRGQEIEFYDRNLNRLKKIIDLLSVDVDDLKDDAIRKGELNLTSVDAVRIAYDLAGRGLLSSDQVEFVRQKTGVTKDIKPILHVNQYLHLLNWLKENDQLRDSEYKKLLENVIAEPFDGI